MVSKETLDRLDRCSDAVKQSIYRVFQWLYLTSYWVGTWVFRRLRVYYRRLADLWAIVFSFLWSHFHRLLERLRLTWRLFLRRIKTPFIESGNFLREAPGLSHSFKEGFGPGMKQLWRNITGFLKVSKPIYRTAFNYIMPCLALVLLAGTIRFFTSMEYGLSIQYSGKSLGYISDESVFTTAENNVKERFSHEEYRKAQEIVPQYQVVPVEESMLFTEDTLTEKLMLSTGSDLTEASGLYIDGKFIGASTNPEGVIDVLDRMLDYYRTDNPDEEVQFIEPIQLKKGMYPVKTVELTNKIEDTLNSKEKEQQTYTVVEGDAPVTIAKKVGMPYSQLKALNPNIEKELFIGQEVIISRSVPLLGVQVIRNETREAPIAYSTEKIETNKKPKGFKEVKTKGENGIRSITERVVYIDGLESERTVLHSEVVKEPVTEEVLVGTYRAPSYSGGGGGGFSHGSGQHGQFIWPVAGGYVSCPFMGYAGHTGMDIAAPSGTPIYASASGRVVRSVWRGPYGQHIIIDHGNGVQTLYAHCSARYVQAGDYVTQGQVIGAVGTTGNSTGNHCHFEIRINGRYMNPANYVGTR